MKKKRIGGSKEKEVYTPAPMAIPHQKGLHNRGNAFLPKLSKSLKKAKKKV